MTNVSRKGRTVLQGQPEHLSWVEYTFAIVLSLVMAFTAGYSNGVTLSGYLHVGIPAVKSPVTGVTNLLTQSAVELGENDISQCKFRVGTIFSVMAGSCVSALLNPRPVAFVLSPRYGPTFIIGSMFSALGAVYALHNNRREFYFTAIGNGIMNGVTSMYSSNLLRTTSYSGPVTDIGLYVGQWLRGNRSNNWRLYILSALTTAFWLGGLAGYEASKAKKQHALILNAVFFGFIGCSVIIFFMVEKHLSFFDALFGLGKLGIRFERVTVKSKMKESDSNNVDESLTKDELMAIYDEILEKEGNVNEDALMSLLASRDLQVKRYRRSIFGIIQAKFAEHDQEGDWTISRDDWEKLVKKTEHMRDSATGVGGSIAPRNDGISAISVLRNASIAQIEATGFVRALEEGEKG